MNKSFLEYTAQDLVAKYGSDLSRLTIVFPNKRASLFMNEHLARMVDRPLWSPTYITISELFRQQTDLVVGDEIKLICDLHKVTVQCTGNDEPLDHFYGWGQLLLSDFDDIDKNMADADKVFANLKDIHELDDVSYLTEEQKQALQHFFANFKEDHNSELKKRFLAIWSHLGDIYHQYNRRLTQQGLAYEGALYRRVINEERNSFDAETYVFIGFNLLQKVERQLFQRLMHEGKAKFYWDFDHYYLTDNEAGHNISQYIEAFPNELDNRDEAVYGHFKEPRQITYLSAPTENIQARYVSQWLRAEGRYRDGQKTAVVLCNETILPFVLHSIPSEVDKVNITTGFPLSQAPVASLITKLIALQVNGHQKRTGKFRLRHVNAVLRHPYAKYISEKSQALYKELNEHKRYYPAQEDLSLDKGLSLLFGETRADHHDEDMSLRPEKICRWILDILQCMAGNAKGEEDPFFQESMFRMFTLVNRLSGLIETGDLNMMMPSFTLLLNQLIRSTNIPFHGEPVEGVQVMGILETRNIDFDHVILLSCNEGQMPREVNDASFIPYSVRKAYGLTTIDNKVSVYSYYFHRLLQRASDITIAYNSATEDGHTGQMSRFMLQLLVESGQNIRKQTLQGHQRQTILHRVPIDKSRAVMEVLESFKTISPTALNRYIRCQLQFYYNMIAGIKEPDNEDDPDQIDNRTFGNIFHQSAQLLYQQWSDRGRAIHQADIEDLLKQPAAIERIVDQAFKDELFKAEAGGFHPEYNGLQIINREVIINYIKQLLKLDANLTPFSIIGLEKKVYADMDFQTANGMRTIKIGGYIDRLDKISQQPEGPRMRVIDYKTGKIPQTKTYTVEEIFAGNDISKKHTDYFFQTMVYAMIIRHQQEINPGSLPVSPALIFIQQASGKDYDPTLTLGKDKIIDIEDYLTDFKERLQHLLSEIFDPNTAFSPATDHARCLGCPYAQLCGI